MVFVQGGKYLRTIAMASPDDILKFWIEDTRPEQWYQASDALDGQIRELFLTDWEQARAGRRNNWLHCPKGSLAFVILTDQFSRNMFRGDARSFATDGIARAAAKMAIKREWDLKIAEPERQFLYMPLMHSENLVDQDRAIRLFMTRMPQTGGHNIPHACVHRNIVRRFGRFPYRNEAMGRETTAEEWQWMQSGGYRIELDAVNAQMAMAG